MISFRFALLFLISISWTSQSFAWGSKKPKDPPEQISSMGTEPGETQSETLESSEDRKKRLKKLIQERNSLYTKIQRDLTFSKIDKCVSGKRAANEKLIPKVKEGLQAVIDAEDKITSEFGDVATNSKEFWGVVWEGYGNWFTDYKPRYWLAAAEFCDKKAGSIVDRRTKADPLLKEQDKQILQRISATDSKSEKKRLQKIYDQSRSLSTLLASGESDATVVAPAGSSSSGGQKE